MYDISTLKEKMFELQDIAKSLKIKKIGSLKKTTTDLSNY